MTPSPSKKLLVRRALAPEFQARLRAELPQFEVAMCNNDLEKFHRELPDAHYVYGAVHRDEFPMAKRLEFIQVTSQGVDWVNYPEIRDSAVLVSNGEGLWSEPMADHVMALMLALLRSVPGMLACQQRREWNPNSLEFHMLRGMTAGFLGAGTVARATLTRTSAFGMRHIACSRTGQPLPGVERMYRVSELHDFLAGADVVISSLPNTPATRGLMDAAAFNAMKPGAVFINVGRGATVDDAALLDALRSGRIGGAALDVYTREPLPPDSPLWDAPNLLLSPHCAGRGRPDYDEATFGLLLENLQRIARGESPRNLIDKSAGY